MKTYLKISYWAIGVAAFAVILALPAASAGLPDELIIGTGWDATRPGDYQPLGMWEPACLIYETLVNLDQAGSPVPCLAESWAVSAAGTSYTFQLHKNVRFHDGTPFNSSAVKLNFDRLGHINWQGIYPAVREVSVVDEHRIRFSLKRPVPLFFVHLAGSGSGIVSPAAMTAKPPAPPPGMGQPGMSGKASAKPPGKGRPAMPKAMMTAMTGNTFVVPEAVGTGPYRWETAAYRRARSFAVLRNSSYWQGKPVFRRITWRVIPDPAARAIALETKEIHLTGQSPNAGLTAENLAALEQHPDLGITKAANWGTRLVLINHRRPPFDKVPVRKAIRHSINTPAIQTVLKDMATVCPGPFGPKSPFTHPNICLPDYDPDLANALLEKAGLRDTDGDGIREFGGAPLAIQFTTSKSGTLAVLVCESLKKIGIQASILPRESGSIFEILNRMDFDLAVHPNIPSFYLDLFHTFHSRGRWSAHVDLPELDPLLDQYATATDMAAFKRLGNRVQEMIHGQHIVLFSVNESKLAAHDRCLDAFRFPPEEWVGAVQDIWCIR